jgi:aspartate aminotransferase
MKPMSRLVTGIPPSAALAVNDKAKAMKAAGHDVILLAGGDPDFATPQHIVDAACAAMRSGATHYPAPTRGIPELLEAIAAKHAEEDGFHVNAMTDIVVTPGAKWALFLALGSVTNPGDEII